MLEGRLTLHEQSDGPAPQSEGGALGRTPGGPVSSPAQEDFVV